MRYKIIPLLCLFILFGCQKNDIDVFNGKDTSLEKLKGQWIVVNYWADWCAPCIKELPELLEFAEENNDVLVYVFNFDELDAEDLAPVAERFNLKLPSLISHPREIWGIETPPAVPATFFISPEGVLVKSLFRPQTKDNLNSVLASLK
ncbi:TlpA family protein disulfide reductase [Gammaproteobacteria bacterium]|nr:TlpA family protein disulfide reductase [Gammaproteobacteria bacterium]